MTTSDEARTLLESITGYARGQHTPDEAPTKLATVVAGFDPKVAAGARVTFDGESSPTLRAFPWLGAPPRASSRVVLIPVGRSWVIVGEVGQIVDPAGQPFVPFRSASGITPLPAVSSTPGGGGVDVSVDFPAGRFTDAPVVVLTPSSTRVNAQISSVTALGFVARFTNWTSGNAAAGAFHWIAQQDVP